jgi:hypothetical protein
MAVLPSFLALPLKAVTFISLTSTKNPTSHD